MLVAFVVGCAHRPAGPTVTGAMLYSHVEALRVHGRVMIEAGAKPIEVRGEQFLVTADQVFVVSQIVENCRGGEPELDVDCALALLRDRRFVVRDQPPQPRAQPGEDELSIRAKLGLTALAIAIPLTYGVATCEFEDCRAIFGLGLALDALGLVILTVGFK